MSLRSRNRPFEPAGRLLFCVIVLSACAMTLVARAAYLQLLQPDFYQQQGDARFVRDIDVPVSRGMILDRNGEPLAVSSPVASIWANPKELLQHPGRIQELASALQIPESTLSQRLAQRSDKEFVFLRRHMNPDDALKVLALDIPGLHSQREFRRFYPHGEVMAHVLGFTNVDDVGQEGLELAFNDWLSGTPGKKRVIRDRRGRTIEDVDLLVAPQSGNDLVLSIDRRVQYLAYRELRTALLEHGASSGSVVVLDIPTGEIIAAVNQPSFNPNSRNNSDTSARRNRVVTDVIEPGSVIKAFTAAAALESGVNPRYQIDTSPGTYPLAGHVIRDFRDYGMVDMERMLIKSSNIAAAKLAGDMSNEHFYHVLSNFGFGKITGSGFPGESSGVLPEPRNWGKLEKATISYGYGLSATPLQIAQSYAALANHGRLKTPTFVRGGTADNESGQQVIDPRSADQVMVMLESVTGAEGTARAANIPGYRVAGKTGTSRRASVGGYERRYISVFAGVVPVDNPRLAMIVAIHDPRGNYYYGGDVSAPVFQKVMEGSLRLLDVQPDRPEYWLAKSPQAAIAEAAPAPAVGGVQ